MAATLSKVVNGYTEAQIDRALQALDLPLLVRVRAELLDLDNTLLFPLDGLQLEGDITHNVTQPMQRGATLRFLQTARDSQHSAPLGTFAATVGAQARLFWLRLGETSGNFADSSGNSRTFTTNGTITYSVDSLAAGDLTNNAIKPNGTTGYASIATAAWQDVSRLTLVIAIRGTGTTQTFMNVNGQSTLRVTSTGTLEFSTAYTSGSPVSLDTGLLVNDGLKHLLCATYDGAYLDVYVDGKRIARVAETRTLAAEAGGGINIGRLTTGTEFSNYVLDDAGMLGRALSPKEIRDEYQTWSGQTNELLIDQDRGDRVKVYYGIRMPSTGTDGTDTAEWPQIVAVLTSPRNDYAQTGSTINISCQDQTRVLQDYTFSSVITLASGGNYISGTNGVLSIAALVGFNTAPWAVTSTSLTAPADIPFEIGTSALDAINYLLTAINYKPIRFSGDGTAIIEPNKLDKDLPVSDVINTTAEKQISDENLSLELEPRKIVREVVVGNGNPEAAVFRGVATSTIHATGITAVFQVDVPDQTTADDLAEQLLSEQLSVLKKRVRLRSLPRPIHDGRDRYNITCPELGINTAEGFVGEEWRLPLNGSTMEHSMLGVVDVL